MSDGAAPRVSAARIVAGVLAGHSLSDLVLRGLDGLPPRDRGLAQELAYGTVRWHPRLNAILKQLLSRPLKAREREVEALLLVGLYQLLILEMPPHAAVGETVAAVGALKKEWARGLTNAVLRRAGREHQALLEKVDGDESAATAHPAWLLQRLQADWPQQWPAVVEANNARPPMTLRVNGQKTTREAYLEALQKADIGATATEFAPCGIRLEQPVGVDRLPGFEAGSASVQDEAAQLAAALVAPAAGERILDACAAPGGKTGHLLELVPEARVVALDRDAARLQRVRENLSRLGLSAEVAAGDAGAPDAWWDGQPFDRILLDAPCSGTGVIRRHPDIKLLRRPSDIDALVQEQRRLLEALWPLLSPGGMLVYSTCSLLRDENDRQLAAFLASRDDAVEEPISAAWGRAAAVGRQILPGENGMDGFYYARLSKTMK
ncbi:16S rRNA (cytosine(967)-C(5))-methyltransferase RsmB [Thiohalomonas denitrificans]|uniref:16S rRNA (cytosine(967)-C(5))-methyltransferase n=1 Tax=Thiohalomonas denitrificans TaxID=415747 RepID=A0A1G5QTT3_9GAMM|nr:16S rRNA (cytosine(967)-C(5))-methyltransferase RsmB [Thiohalomonas denitrificans]SCZ64489.1 16S rRNA (cytosine967-C5)-methyltransferase [Thiohalomonas denitrificans]